MTKSNSINIIYCDIGDACVILTHCPDSKRTCR